MNKNSWPTQLNTFPYAQPFVIGWQISDHSKDMYWNDYEHALNTYLASRDAQQSTEKQRQYLLDSLELFQALYKQGDSHIGTSLALIRINLELNDHEKALNALEDLLQIMPWFSDPIPDELQIHVNRPFLPPVSNFDNQSVGDNLAQWLQTSFQEVLKLVDAN